MANITSTGTTASTDANATASSVSSIPSGEERVQQIKDMYDASLASNKANLESSYQTNLSNAQADKAKIGEQYTGEKNNLAAEYERQRRNNNMQAQSNGLNTGAGSQMALAQQANYQSNATKLSKAQATAEGEADRNISNITMQYQSAVNDAVAQNDYQKAAALLDEYNNQKNDAMTQASALAQYGDFSLYAQLYGQDVANNMSKVWSLSNPDLAYTLGKITAGEYYKMMGRYPNGYNAGGGGGGWYGGGGGGGQDDTQKEPIFIPGTTVYGTYTAPSGNTYDLSSFFT